MADINITNFGGFYTTGNSIQSIALGDDGSVYLAGGKNVGTPGNGPDRDMDLAIFCYKHGVLQWEKVFGGLYKYEAFMSLSYKDGFVYASGGIGYGFRTDDEGLPGAAWPSQKPFYPERTGLEPDSAVGQPTLATVFVKLDATTGETVIGKVVDSSTSGNLGISSIDADTAGNIYVTSDHKIFSYAQNESFPWNDVHADSAVKAIDGVIWAQAGSRITKIDSTGALLKNYYPKSDNEDELGIVDFVIDADGNIIVALQKQDLNKGNLSDDLWSLGLNPKKQDIPKGLVTTQIRKISGETGEFLWTATLNEECISFPSSISLTPDGKILVTGSTIGNLNGGNDIGEKSFGTFDAYFVTLENGANGTTILQTQIIGTSTKSEHATKGIFDSDQNLFLSGEFNSKYFELKNSGFQNVYLISDTGFTLMGDDSDNIIHGGDGKDSINGGLGSDLLNGGLGTDTIDGGKGFDVANYESSDNAITANLQTGTASGLDIGKDFLKNIEEARGGSAADVLTANNSGSKLVGGGGNDKLTGGAGADVLYGGDGNDTVNAGAGNDEIVGGDGAGNDAYIGGAGTDTIKYSSALAGITVNLAATSDHAKSTGANDAAGIGTDQLSQIENVIGGNYDDIISGNTSANLLDGGAGADTLSGGDGNDTYMVDSTDDIIIESNQTNGGVDEIRSSVTRIFLENNVEKLTLTGNAAINGTGNLLANTIVGNSANNSLDGGAGADTLSGGLGDDTYIVDNAKDLVTERANEGTDTIQTNLSSFSLAKLTAIERLYYVGSSNANLAGNSLSNTLTGSTGNDTLDGGTGTDSLLGGNGNDTYVVDSANDRITEISDEGIDTVLSSVTHTLSDNVENLILSGKTAISGTGNDLANAITGNAAANNLSGGLGSDTLDGGLGNDTLTGGNGADYFRFSSALGKSNIDTISSFIIGEDKLQLDDAIFKKLQAGALSSGRLVSGGNGVKALDSDDYLIFNTDTKALFYDADGNGNGKIASMVQFATLVGATGLSETDFWVV